MTRIFISYSRTDYTFASQLANQLTAMGLDIFLDVEDIHAGADWSDTIQQGLDTSHLMLLIVSPASMQSQQVGREWKYFIGRGKPIVPLQWKATPVHYQLDSLQRINFETQRFDIALQQLIAHLTRMGVFAQTPVPSPSRYGPLTPPPAPMPTQKRKRFPVGLWAVGLVMTLAVIGGIIFASGVLSDGNGKESNDDNRSNGLPTEAASNETPLLTYSVLKTSTDGEVENAWIEAWDMTTSTRREFTRDPDGFSIGTFWSPDGKHVAFLVYSRVFWSLQIADAAGGNLREVIRREDSEIALGNELLWSPDSRYLAYVYVNRDASPSLYDIRVYDYETNATQYVVQQTPIWETTLVWANHSNQLATFYSFDDGNDTESTVLRVWDADSGATREIKSFLEVNLEVNDVERLQWYPDDSAFLLTASMIDLLNANSTELGPFNYTQIYRVGLGGDFSQITTTASSKGETTLSPDGTLIAYTDDYEERCARVWIMRLSDGEVIGEIKSGGVGGEDYCDEGPVWSPDSRQITFVRQTDDTSSDLDILAVARVSNLIPTKIANVVEDAADSNTYAWSPDSQYLGYVSAVLMPDTANLETATGVKMDVYLVNINTPDQPLLVSDVPASQIPNSGSYYLIALLAWRPVS